VRNRLSSQYDHHCMPVISLSCWSTDSLALLFVVWLAVWLAGHQVVPLLLLLLGISRRFQKQPAPNPATAREFSGSTTTPPSFPNTKPSLLSHRSNIPLICLLARYHQPPHSRSSTNQSCRLLCVRCTTLSARRSYSRCARSSTTESMVRVIAHALSTHGY